MHESRTGGGGGGSSLLDRAAAASGSRDTDGHAALSRDARGGKAVAQQEVGTVVHVPDADEEADGGVGEGAVPVTTVPSHVSTEGAPPPEGDALSASPRVSFAGGMHLHTHQYTNRAGQQSLVVGTGV